MSSGFDDSDDEYNDEGHGNDFNRHEEGNDSNSGDMFTSPLILPIVILLYSAFQPALMGIFYMICLIISSGLRMAVFSRVEGHIPAKCGVNILYATTLNPIVFISMFSLLFILMPMFIYSQYNIYVIVILLCYVVTSFSLTYKCFKSTPAYLLYDIIGGGIFGLVSYFIISAIHKDNQTNFLFITSPSSVEKCSMASTQNFVCKVYKNGQLISTPVNIPGYTSS